MPHEWKKRIASVWTPVFMTSHGVCVVSIATTKESFDQNIAPKGGEATCPPGRLVIIMVSISGACTSLFLFLPVPSDNGSIHFGSWQSVHVHCKEFSGEELGALADFKHELVGKAGWEFPIKPVVGPMRALGKNYVAKRVVSILGVHRYICQHGDKHFVH